MDPSTPTESEAITPGPLSGASDQVLEEVTEHDQDVYLPEKERERRQGLALCLSGGGFRAALFHLGALRRLNELGVLSKVESISSVSGGSIISAYLAQHLAPWPSAGSVVPVDTWERMVQPFRDFAQTNLRTKPLFKRVWPLQNLFFQNGQAVEALMERYKRNLTSLTLRELPDRPRFIFCSCELSYGVNWIFSKEAVGDYQVGYMRPAPDWPVARAVAASSCFPPAFDPMPVPDDFKSAKLVNSKARKDDPNYAKNLASISLNDAGVYDNLGLEPVWKSHKPVLVSDGGATFDPEWDKGIIWRTSRPISVIGNQATAIRKRWLISTFTAHNLDVNHTNPYALKGTYWGIGTPTSRYAEKGEASPPGYSIDSVINYIAQVRTDMDAFTPDECQILENHGYLLADAAANRYVPELIEANAMPLAVPHPAWFSGANLDARVQKALKESGVVKLLGRGFKLFGG